MQQSLTEASAQADSGLEYRARRGSRPMFMKRAQIVFITTLVLLDFGITWFSFYLSHLILDRNPDVIIGPFLEFWKLPLLYSVLLVSLFFTQRMYQRTASDQPSGRDLSHRPQ